MKKCSTGTEILSPDWISPQRMFTVVVKSSWAWDCQPLPDAPVKEYVYQTIHRGIFEGDMLRLPSLLKSVSNRVCENC